MSDLFDDFLNRLERPVSEPVIVTFADKVMDVQVACVRRTGLLMEQALCIAMPGGARGRKPVRR